MPTANNKVGEARTFRPTVEGGVLAPQILDVSATSDLTLAFDLCEVINTGDSIESVVEVVEMGTTEEPTITEQAVSDDSRSITFRISGFNAGKQVRIRCDVLTKTGDRLSHVGLIQVA